MTTELEQEFFKCFGIEPDCTYLFLIDGNGENKAARTMSFGSKADLKRFVCECGGKGKVIKATGSPHIYYPEITDRKLLELICINSYFCGVNFHNLWVKNPDELKAIILDEIIRWYNEQKYGHEKCKHQIQQLFKEEE